MPHPPVQLCVQQSFNSPPLRAVISRLHSGSIPDPPPPVPSLPQAVHNRLRDISRTLVPRRQEDAHEFLRCLVDAMERDLLKGQNRYSAHRPLRVRERRGGGGGGGGGSQLRGASWSRRAGAAADVSGHPLLAHV